MVRRRDLGRCKAKHHSPVVTELIIMMDAKLEGRAAAMCSRPGRMEPHGQDLQDCKNHAADSVARFVSSKTFLSFCLVAFGAVCLDQGLEFSKILDNAVDVPLYEFFANRKPAFQKSLAEHVLGLQEPGEAGVKWHGVGTVWLKRLAQRSVLCEKILSLVSVGRVLSNGPVFFAAGSICAVAAFHALCLLLGSRGRSSDGHRRGLTRFAVILFFSYVCGGKGLACDTATMLLLKNYFGRLRPREYAHDTRSLAFPSGHTNGASFFCGVLAALVLPNLLSTLMPGWANGRKPKLGRSGLALLTAWVVLTAATAVGRVVSLKHWCSDCVCGSFTGAITVSLASIVALSLESRLLRPRKPEGKAA